MIVLDNVTKILSVGQIRTSVLVDASVTLPTDRRLAILGHHGSGKSTLIQLIAGLLSPTSGLIERYARISFPVGFNGGFRPRLSLRQNIAHAARLYGADVDEVTHFVTAVTNTQAALEEPLAGLPQQMRNCIFYAIGYAIPFDTYLFDNTIWTGDQEFREKCEAMFESRAQSSGMILATRNVQMAARVADMGAILNDRELTIYEDIKEAVAAFKSLGEVQRVGQYVRAGDPGIDPESEDAY